MLDTFPVRFDAIKKSLRQLSFLTTKQMQFMQKSAFSCGRAGIWLMSRFRCTHVNKTLLVMKLTILMLMVCMLNVHAKGVSQTISLTETNVSMRSVFASIEKQTGYVVFGNASLLKDRYSISCDVKDMKLTDFLNVVLKDMPIGYTIEEKTIMLFRKEYAADSGENTVHKEEMVIDISGRVLSADGEPLSGATIQIKGTGRGTTTDEKGNFSLTIPDEGAVLVVSFVGFQNMEVKVSAGSVPSIRLQPVVASADEVVVVGYGTQKKINLTGAVSSVNARMIENRLVTSLAGALQGAAAGLVIGRTSGQPGLDNYTFQVRGATSANGNVNPLVILDGVTSSTSVLLTLNPNDIDNVTILKDAAAASIYGAQAAGGVMIITTKRGKTGKASFTYSNIYSYQKPMNVPERMTLLEEALYINAARTSVGWGPEYAQADIDRMRLGVKHYVLPYDTTRYQYYNSEPLLPQLVKDYSAMKTHNFSARGGTENTHYLISLGLYDQDGIFKVGPDKFKRYNTRINFDTKLTSKITFDAKIGFAVTDLEQPTITPNGTYSTSLLNMLYRFRQRYPLLTPEGRYGDNSGAGITTYAILESGGNNKVVNRNLDGVFTLRSQDWLVKGLNLTGIFGGQYYTGSNATFIRTVTTWFRTRPGNILQNPNSYTRGNSMTWNSNAQFLADYDWKLGSNHSFHILGGYQWNSYRSFGVTSSARNLISNDLGALNIGDNLTKTATEWISTSAYQSVFGRLNYNYDDRFLFEATVRADESSRLAPGQRTKVFPAMSAGWNIANEKWFGGLVPKLDELKLRASWGKMGSAEGGIIGNYDFIERMYSGTGLILGSAENRATYFYNGNLASASLTWETVDSKNIGIDVSAFKRKLNLSFDYYIKHNNNMLTPQELSSMLGVGAPIVNNGKLRSWGWEIQASYRDRTGGGLGYGFSANLSDNQNKLIKYQGNDLVWAGTVNLLEGYPLGTIWGYQTNGYIQDADMLEKAPFYDTRIRVGDVLYVDQDRNGIINSGNGTVNKRGDLIYLGTNQARYTFGFTGSFDYKGFDLQIFIQGVLKRSFMGQTAAIHPNISSWLNPVKMHLDYWTPENRDAAFPIPYPAGNQSYAPSDKWLFNGAYARLKNIQIGYTFPKTLLNTIKISQLRVFVGGQDIVTWDKLGVFRQAFNPEHANGTGHDYPLFATYSFGVNLTF